MAEEHVVKIKTTADLTGTDKAAQGFGDVEKKAKRTAAESKSGFEQMQAGVGKVSGAFGALRNVITGFGIGGVIMAITGGLSKIVGSFGAAQKSAEEFRAIQQKLAEDKAIASLANDYAKLTDAINAAAAAENHQLEMIDIEVANRRKLSEAKLNAAKEDEIAALDANAKDYAEQLDKIEKKYAAIKAAQAASNATEDIVLARQKTNAQADQTYAQAGAQDAATKAIQAKIAAALRAKSASEYDATALNENDKTGVASIIGKTLNQLFTGDWGRMSGAKTSEGDQVRKSAAEKAAQYEEQIQKLEEEKRKSEEKASELRKQAERLRQKSEAMGGQIDAAEIEGNTARKTAARGEKTAQSALNKNHAYQDAEAAKISDAEAARRALTQQKAYIQAKIAAEQAKKDEAGRTAYEAQGNLDMANLGTDVRARRSATAALQEAQNAAQNVNHAADTAINALTETLKNVESRLKAAQNFLESQSKQQRNAWTESPAGA